jgi:hypothetical protein
MATVTSPDLNIFHKTFQAMQEIAKNLVNQNTLIPLSLVITLVMILAGFVVSHTTLTNKVERLEFEMRRVEERYITKELYQTRMDIIQRDIQEIKELLKGNRK